MPIHPAFLVRDMQGRPLPSPELIAKLKKYDPRIGVFYRNVGWAITEAWGEHDPRRQWIQNGSMQPEYAFDICGDVPLTCSLDEVPAFIERELSSWTPDRFKGLREAVNHWNDVQLEKQIEDQVMSAVSNDLDRSDIVTPGIYEPVLKDFELPGEAPAPPPFDFSHVAAPEFSTATPAQLDSMAKAREVLAQKRLDRKAASA